MSSNSISDHDLAGYLDEALPQERMAAIEQALRADGGLRDRIVKIRRNREDGQTSVGEIWRTARLTCPTRPELGSYLLGVLEDDLTDYIRFHIETIGCRVCRANAEDIEQSTRSRSEETVARRQKFFQSSAGYVRREPEQ